MKLFLQILITFFFHISWAQNFSVDYDRIQIVNKDLSDVTNNKFEINYISADSIDLSLKYLNNQYNFYIIDYNTQFLQKMYSLEFIVKKTFTLKNNWAINFSFKPQFNTNDVDLMKIDNFYPNSEIGFLKKSKSNKYKFYLGVEYGNLLGMMSFYPIFNFENKINKYIDFKIGFPKSQIRFKYDNKNYLIFNSSFSSHFWNINQNSNSRIINNTNILSYDYLYSKQVNTSLEYNYLFENYSIINFEIGKAFNNTLEINESNNSSNNFNFNNQFYVKMGIKYNFNL